MKSLAALCISGLLLVFPSTARAEDRFFGADKGYHFAATAIVASGSYAITASVTDDRAWRIGVGLAAGLSAGAAKEGWDALGYGDPSSLDLVWDVFGTAAGVGLAYLVDRLISSDSTGERQSTSARPLTIRF